MGGYTPLFSDIVMSSIWAEDAETCKVWVTLMALANAEGIVSGSIVGLAGAARVSIEVCQKALDKFLSPDPYSRTRDDEGRRIKVVDGGWLLINHRKHRERAKSRAEYYRLYRKKFPPIPPSKEETNTTNYILQTAQQSCNTNNVAQQLQGNRFYTEKEVQDACWQLPPEAWRLYFDHFNAQGWVRANGQPIRNLTSHISRMWDKASNKWVFEKGSKDDKAIDRDKMDDEFERIWNEREARESGI